MRKHLLLVFTILLLTTSCNKNQTFRIEGRVINPEFFGSKVYLVALDAPVTKNVDSTIVENGQFTFEIKADSFSAKILRIPSKYPLFVEDLVVIPEQGKIDVVLDTVSRGNGTRLNNIMQQWKERKHIHDSIMWDLHIRSKAENIVKPVSDSLLKVSEKMNELFLSDNICLINENLYNGIGLLIYKIYFDALPVSEKNFITEKVGNMYLERDAQLRKRFY